MRLTTLPVHLLLLPPPPRCAPLMRERDAESLVLKNAEDYIVVNKPAGVPVHGDTEDTRSLISLLQRFGDVAPVHRLDAETSGVMLLAKTPAAAARLQACLKDAATVKRYRGVLNGAPSREVGTWSQSLSGKPEGRRNPRGVAASRLTASTGYRVLDTPSSGGRLCLADFTLSASGRTHQIRKHAAIAGVPVLGDVRYGEPKRAAARGFEGMALHASMLRISIDGTLHTFEAPLPQAWSPLLDALGVGGEAAGDEASGGQASASQLPALSYDDAMHDRPCTRPREKPPQAAAASGGAARLGGRCVKWSVRKGFGFISQADGSDVYCHQRSIDAPAEGADGFRSLREGEAVEFELAEMADGRLEAVRVTGPDGRHVAGQPPPKQAQRGAFGGAAGSTTRPRRSKPRRKKKAAVADGPLPPGAYAPKLSK